MRRTWWPVLLLVAACAAPSGHVSSEPSSPFGGAVSSRPASTSGAGQPSLGGDVPASAASLDVCFGEDITVERGADGPWALHRCVRAGVVVTLLAMPSPGFRFGDAVSSDAAVAAVRTTQQADGSARVVVTTAEAGDVAIRLTDPGTGDPSGPASKTLVLTIAVS